MKNDVIQRTKKNNPGKLSGNPTGNPGMPKWKPVLNRNFIL